MYGGLVAVELHIHARISMGVMQYTSSWVANL
jgi:hypothetical protein